MELLGQYSTSKERWSCFGVLPKEEVPVALAEAIVPQEKVEQIASETVALAVELLQKQKETVRNIALALNEIILLSHEFANSSIDLRLSDLRHLNNLSPPAVDDEDDIVPKNVWVSGTIGITKYNGKCLLSSYTGRTSAATIGGDLELPNGELLEELIIKFSLILNTRIVLRNLLPTPT